MARESRKRPTEAQILRSQKDYASRVARQTFNEAAASIGVTPRQLKNYMFGKRKYLSSNFWRNNVTRKLYMESLPPRVQEEREVEHTRKVYDRKTGKQVERTYKTKEMVHVRRGRPTIAGIKVPQIKITRSISSDGDIIEKIYTAGTDEERRLASVYTHAILLEHESPNAAMSIAWQLYTAQHDLPISINDIKERYADGEITKRQAAAILSHWHAIYSDMTDDWYEEMVDEFAEYDELRDDD